MLVVIVRTILVEGMKMSLTRSEMVWNGVVMGNYCESDRVFHRLISSSSLGERVADGMDAVWCSIESRTACLSAAKRCNLTRMEPACVAIYRGMDTFSRGSFLFLRGHDGIEHKESLRRNSFASLVSSFSFPLKTIILSMKFNLCICAVLGRCCDRAERRFVVGFF